MAWKAYNTINGQIMGEVSDAPGANATDYLTDALGSVVATVSGGKLLNTYRWSGYGQQVLKTGIGPDPKFLWVGGWGYRASSSLAYVRARHYSSARASWTTVDPLWPWQRSNIYTVNPVTQIDPTGTYVASCDDDWRPTATMNTICGRSGLVWYVPFFCNHHPGNWACPIYSPGMTGALPNVNYDVDIKKEYDCGCGRIDRARCRFKSHRPPIYDDPNLNALCGDCITVSKRKCKVKIQIIDRGPAKWTGAHVDLHPQAARAFWECLNPGKTFAGCKNFGRIQGVTIAHG